MPTKLTLYTLCGQQAVECDNVTAWAKWMETAERLVAASLIGDVRVRTMFLAIDHRYGNDGPPLLFETEIFGGALHLTRWQYPTWDEAEAGHERAMALVRETGRRATEPADPLSQEESRRWETS